jgi:hypothetical protein
MAVVADEMIRNPSPVCPPFGTRRGENDGKRTLFNNGTVSVDLAEAKT